VLNAIDGERLMCHVKVAAVQMHVAFGDVAQNSAKIASRLREAAAAGAQLTVFPECALTGYCFDSLEEALPHGQPIPGPSTECLSQLCVELQVSAIYGLLERDGSRLYNACVLVGPQGVVGSYRKVHLPYLGVDRFTTPGDRPFAVHKAGEVRVGMSICYDGSFPEAARVLALKKADLIVLPTNWPPGAEATAQHVPNTRALENHVYYMAINRVGTERGFRFIGRSKVCDVHGNTLAEAPDEEEAVLLVEIEPELARNKRIVRVPDKHIIDRIADRRPAMYGEICRD
jgi:predicted amidohydrolase